MDSPKEGKGRTRLLTQITEMQNINKPLETVQKIQFFHLLAICHDFLTRNAQAKLTKTSANARKKLLSHSRVHLSPRDSKKYSKLKCFLNICMKATGLYIIHVISYRYKIKFFLICKMFQSHMSLQCSYRAILPRTGLQLAFEFFTFTLLLLYNHSQITQTQVR